MVFKAINTFKSRFLLVLFLGLTPLVAFSASEEGEDFNPSDMIFHHIVDSHYWEFWDGPGGTLYLPVIIYDLEEGLRIFSSHHFFDEEHNPVPYQGYLMEHDHVESVAGATVIDFSITKNVAAMFLSALILVLVFTTVARGYRKNQGKAPTGIQSFFEPIIVFIRDEVAKPNIGPKYERFMPYLLTIFFFIWFNNMLGLLPGAANVTGNLAVTLTLAILTFLITQFNGTKDYWSHIFNTPGVPWWLKFGIPIMPIVEFIGIFTKPFSLMVRLFANITAGHIIILSLFSLIFIFESLAVGPLSVIFATFMNFLELFVALLQAFIFTLLSAMYFGGAVATHHDEHHVDDVGKAAI